MTAALLDARRACALLWQLVYVASHFEIRADSLLFAAILLSAVRRLLDQSLSRYIIG